MKPKRLMLVTSFYPSGPGETFVKAELEHIAKYFEEIEIVPSFHDHKISRSAVNHPVNLGYSASRWGLFRACHVLSSLTAALVRYPWRADAGRILHSGHKFANIKELARALYRAQLFEWFLDRQIIKEGREISLVYFYWMIPEIVGAARFCRRTGFPLKIVCRAHRGDLYEDTKPGGYAGLRSGIVEGIDEIYCISEHGKAYLAKQYPLYAKKLHIARLGVNDPGYVNAQPDDDALSIVSCSFVIASKRVHLIADAIDYLLVKDPSLKIKWTHIGDGEVYEQLRAYILSKLADRAQVICTGYMEQPQVMQLYRETGFDVFVNVSDSEGVPVSLMEASSVGIPVVATDVGGSCEIVNASNGVLLPANPEVAAIAAALLLFKDKAAAAVYRRGARAYWAQKFNAPLNYNHFGQELQHVLKWHTNAA